MSPVLQPPLPSKKTTYNFTSFRLSAPALIHLWSLFNRFFPFCCDTPRALPALSPVSSVQQGTACHHQLIWTAFFFLFPLSVFIDNTHVEMRIWAFVVTPHCLTVSLPHDFLLHFTLSISISLCSFSQFSLCLCLCLFFPLPFHLAKSC